jgi:hypothetical protein
LISLVNRSFTAAKVLSMSSSLRRRTSSMWPGTRWIAACSCAALAVPQERFGQRGIIPAASQAAPVVEVPGSASCADVGQEVPGDGRDAGHRDGGAELDHPAIEAGGARAAAPIQEAQDEDSDTMTRGGDRRAIHQFRVRRCAALFLFTDRLAHFPKPNCLVLTHARQSFAVAGEGDGIDFGVVAL